MQGCLNSWSAPSQTQLNFGSVYGGILRRITDSKAVKTLEGREGEGRWPMLLPFYTKANGAE